MRARCHLKLPGLDGVCFEHAQNARRLSAFYAMPLRCYDDAAGMLAILLRTPLRSDFFFGRRENATLV
jgi:hypothetical protein